MLIKISLRSLSAVLAVLINFFLVTQCLPQFGHKWSPISIPRMQSSRLEIYIISNFYFHFDLSMITYSCHLSEMFWLSPAESCPKRSPFWDLWATAPSVGKDNLSVFWCGKRKDMDMKTLQSCCSWCYQEKQFLSKGHVLLYTLKSWTPLWFVQF